MTKVQAKKAIKLVKVYFNQRSNQKQGPKFNEYHWRYWTNLECLATDLLEVLKKPIHKRSKK